MEEYFLSFEIELLLLMKSGVDTAFGHWYQRRENVPGAWRAYVGVGGMLSLQGTGTPARSSEPDCRFSVFPAHALRRRKLLVLSWWDSQFITRLKPGVSLSPGKSVSPW